MGKNKICADTDVFVLLCNMYVVKGWWDVEVFIQGFNSQHKEKD